jgi:hypothetical protein
LTVSPLWDSNRLVLQEKVIQARISYGAGALKTRAKQAKHLSET